MALLETCGYMAVVAGLGHPSSVGYLTINLGLFTQTNTSRDDTLNKKGIEKERFEKQL
jgi:hypothetical protein